MLARLTKVQILLALSAMILEHGRDCRDMRLEWYAVADVSHCVLMALSLSTDAIDGLTVHDETMARTANAYGDTICTETLVFEAVKQLGKSNAHEIIFEITQTYQRKRIPMRRAFESNPRVGAIMPKEILARLLEPWSHLGMIGTIVDKVLDRVASHH